VMTFIVTKKHRKLKVYFSNLTSFDTPRAVLIATMPPKGKSLSKERQGPHGSTAKLEFKSPAEFFANNKVEF
jgi:hypothetical protein